VEPPWLIAIAASAGGIQALGTIVSGLPRELPAAVAIVRHGPPPRPSSLRQILSRRAHLPIADAFDGEAIRSGVVYLASPTSPQAVHLTVTADRHFVYTDGRRIRFLLSAADPLLESAAAVFKTRLIAVVLTGAGAGGTYGVQCVNEHGGLVIAQDPGSAADWTIPHVPVYAGSVDLVLALHSIAPALVALVGGASADALAFA
jgi:two-component system chemotaxis response regulator CheB